MQKLPQYVNEALEILDAGGYKAYLVGGCVRDLFMGRCPKDYDIATNALPEEVQGLFSKTIPTGLAHGTVTVVIDSAQIEVTTFRKDGDYLDNRRPEQVVYVDALTEDLTRRDFTMNAMAMNRTGEIEDPFDGGGDIRRKIIRCVGDPNLRFTEDALRMFRALRFSAQLGFQVTEDTRNAIKVQSSLATRLSAERVRDEVEKILRSESPEVLREVIEYGLLDAYLSRTSIDIETFQKLEHIKGIDTRWCAFVAILLNSGAITDPKSFLKALRLPRRTVEEAGMAASLAQNPLPADQIALKHLLAAYGEKIVRLTAEANHCLSGCNSLDDIEQILQNGVCYQVKDLALQGKDLLAYGIPEGSEIGEILQKLLAEVIKDPAKNTREGLLKVLEAYMH